MLFFFILEDVNIGNFQIVNIENDDDDDDELMDHDDPSRIRLSCFAHTLQLCVRDGLKNAPHVSKLLGKCQTIAKYSHKSSKIADLLEQLNRSIHKMNLTRWNSEYLLIKSIYSIGKNDLQIITSAMDDPVKFSNNDFSTLEEIINILEPFYEITVKCQAETVVTASIVVPSIVHLTSHLRDIQEDTSFCSKLIQQLHESITKRYSGIIKRLNLLDVDKDDPYSDPLYFMTTVLDPSFKFYWSKDLKLSMQMENRLKQHIIQLIIDEMNKDSKKPESDLNPVNSTSTTTYNNSTPKPKRRKLFNYDETSMDDSNDSSTLDPAVELDAYINDPVRTKFSYYWFHSQLNILKKLVMRLFSVQASSAPIERVFSHAGLILSAKRAKMNESLLRELVFLNVNQNLL